YVKFMRVKEILDSKPLVRDDLPKRYILTLSNLLRIQIDTGRINEALEMIQMMRKVSKKTAFSSEDIALRVFKSTYLAEMRIYEKKGEYEKAISNIDIVVNGLDINEGRMNKEQELLFLNTISTVYFGAGRYKESLQWLNRVLNDNEPNLRQDLYSYARLFNLVVHFELGNYDLLEYIIKSTTRYLSKRERDHDLEVVILNYMKRLVRGTQNSDLHEIFVEFKEELSAQLSRQNDEIILDHFNFIIWIDSKLKGIPFDQATKEQYEITIAEA
ncbi:MAG: tetratricopeptide (TPR) repeat protein, partial [Gammaproteobacteria bacterium]